MRGFGDPHPVELPSGRPVCYQADGATVVPPFRPDVGNLALTFIEDLDHSWDGGHQMFNRGGGRPAALAPGALSSHADLAIR